MINEERIKQRIFDAKTVYNNHFPLDAERLKKWADSLEDKEDYFVACRIYKIIEKRNTNTSTLVWSIGSYLEEQLLKDISSSNPLHKA